ncbi:beta-ketoacyl synthase N-terminal-like domain-containing protein, partial [Dactylosporangium sp. NPDC005572]|uniref:beta-ketoacyl synthase N-terminal-like domain-containing protein n=1 Tax=Dactylosporangium sp. NPDC005572 TaxID=3156889 RepID=UPI0033BA12AB
MANPRKEDVVVTGLGAITPLGADVPALWDGMLAGRSGVRRIDDLVTDYEFHDDLPVRIGAPMATAPATLLDRVQARRMD